MTGHGRDYGLENTNLAQGGFGRSLPPLLAHYSTLNISECASAYEWGPHLRATPLS